MVLKITIVMPMNNSDADDAGDDNPDGNHDDGPEVIKPGGTKSCHLEQACSSHIQIVVWNCL